MKIKRSVPLLTIGLGLLLVSATLTTRAYAPPQISVSPDALASTQHVNEVTSAPLTISNGNGVPLTIDVTIGGQVSFFAVSKELYGYDVPSGWLRVIGTEDGTHARVINLADGSLIGSSDLNRYASWDVYPNDGTPYKVEADKPVLGYESDWDPTWGHTTFVPSLDSGPVGREFILDYFRSTYFSAVYVFAVDDSSVTVYDVGGNQVAASNLSAGEYWDLSLPNGLYRAVSTGRVAIETVGTNGYTTVPASDGKGTGNRFLFATVGDFTGALAVFAYEDAQVKVYDLDSGSLLYDQHIDPGAYWWQRDVGTRRLRLESTGRVEVWAGDAEGGPGIEGLGDDISFAGGDRGKEYYLHSLAGGSVIFAPFDNTDVSVDDVVHHLNKDQFLLLDGCCYFRHIRSSQPILIQTLGADNAWNDLGTYLGGVLGDSGSASDWLTAEPLNATIPANSSLPLQVTFNASGLQPGDYTTHIYVSSNDPIRPSVSVPVNMTVEPTATMGWVQGTVTDRVSGEPVAATISAEGQPYAVSTGPDGIYKLWLEEGSYTLRAAATTYVDRTAPVDILAGSVTVQDFALERATPPNDNLADAVLVNAQSFDASVATHWATTELGEPLNNCESASRTVWYKLVLDHNAQVRANAGGFFQNLLTVYREDGPGFSDLSMITCGALGSSLNFQAQAGIVYYLQLGSISGYTPDRNLTIHIEELTRPANDDFANAKLVADLPFNDGVDNSGATTEVGEPKPSCAPSMYKTVWYAFIPAASQRFTAYADAWFGKTFAVWTGSALFDLAEIGCRNSWYYGRLTFSAEAGKTYYIQIGSSEDYNSGWLNTGLDVTPSPVVGFWVSPGDPSIFDAVQFYNASYDPIEEGIKTMAWDFGDGATSSDWNPIHQYAKDGDYTVNLTVTTLDGRTASSQQVVPVKTHDVGITRIAAPTAAHAGQTRPIVVSIKNTRYPEDVRVELYKSTPTGFQGISDTVKTIPVRLGGRMTSVTFNYTFTAVDARMGKVTFKAVATLLNSRDVWPADNEAISVPTKVSK